MLQRLHADAAVARRTGEPITEAVVTVPAQMRRGPRWFTGSADALFQNLNLLRQVKTGLESLSFDVYAHEQVPTNDGGLALGQAVAGRAMYEKIKK